MKNVRGKIGITLFFFIFFAMGSLFVFFIAKEFGKAAETYFWKKTECQIVSSEVETISSDENPYRFNVYYEYSFGGQRYSSREYTTTKSEYSDYSKADRLAHRYSEGSRHFCFVNPSDPLYAVLKRGNLWFGLVVLFPMIFVVIGLGGIWGVWFAKEKTSKSKWAERSITGESKAKAKGPVFFFGIFFVVGFAVFFFAFLRPAYKVLSAKTWSEVPCEILSSEVRSHSDSDGTTYNVDILYAYVFQGREYRSNRYDFLGGSSSGYQGKYKIVRQYPKGSQAYCYVNPSDPNEAVLNRGFTKLIFVLGGFSSIFVLVGLFGIIGSSRKMQDPSAFTGAATPRFSSSQRINFDAAQYDGPVTLKTKVGPVGKLFSVSFFAVFWNGFLILAASLELGHRPTFSEMIGFLNHVPFLWIFQAIGVLILGGVVYQFLAIFNPQPLLTLSSAQIPLGASADLYWKMKGQASRIRDFSIILEGREEATYRRGTNTYTDRKTFFVDTIVSTQNASQIAAGEGIVRIPVDKMHTFKSSNNKILWFIKVHGEIASWPDVKEEFEITVMPLA